MSRAVVKTGAGMPIEVETSSGHNLTFDLPGDSDGDSRGPSSTEGVSASLASCTVGTLRVYADRKGWNLEGLETTVETTYDGPNPTLFEVKLGFPPHLDEEQVSRLMVIAGKCPVHRLLAETTTVEVGKA